MTKICKKAAQDFHRAVSNVFDRVKFFLLDIETVPTV
jgi:hypothetical protein